jgi:hypothetical protein
MTSWSPTSFVVRTSGRPSPAQQREQSVSVRALGSPGPVGRTGCKKPNAQCPRSSYVTSPLRPRRSRIIHQLSIFCGGCGEKWPIHIADRRVVKLLLQSAGATRYRIPGCGIAFPSPQPRAGNFHRQPLTLYANKSGRRHTAQKVVLLVTRRLRAYHGARDGELRSPRKENRRRSNILLGVEHIIMYNRASKRYLITKTYFDRCRPYFTFAFKAVEGWATQPRSAGMHNIGAERSRARCCSGSGGCRDF